MNCLLLIFDLWNLENIDPRICQHALLNLFVVLQNQNLGFVPQIFFASTGECH